MSIANYAIQWAIINLQAFKSSIIEGHDLLCKRIKSAICDHHNLNIGAPKSMFYNCIQNAHRAMSASSSSTLKSLPSFLRQFQQLNPNSRVSLQLENKNRFCQLFFSIGKITKIINNIFPVLLNDGCDRKTSNYNGVCLFFGWS
jgi:hypothetical protein